MRWKPCASNADGSTGNAIARAGAKAWLDAMETMRQRFNSAGGDVGKLDYGYLPQPHDQARVLRAGPDKWSAQVLPLLDRSRYLNEDGSRMSDAQVLDFLKAAHDTIATGGANKREPGAFAGTGARANRGAESREIHFASGDAYLQYLAKYGGGSMFDAMVGHVAQRARSRGAAAALELLQHNGLDTEPKFLLALEALLEVLPVPPGLRGETGEAEDHAGDFDALEKLRRLAFADQIGQPEQLRMFEEQQRAMGTAG